MKTKAQEKEAARVLRGMGTSIKGIAKQLHVSQSSVSLWVRDISITEDQRAALYANAALKARSGSFSSERLAAYKKRGIEQAASAWKQIVAEIETTGSIPGNSEEGKRRRARHYVIETAGQVCTICGGTEWNHQPMPVVLDHINGNAGDWSLTNLRLVCPNCDTFSATYKGRNRGHGRHARRVRYQNGQSY